MPEAPPKVPLVLAPTPLHKLPYFSQELSLDLWIKRDDLTGFAMGGNKGRKLEFLIADALARDAEVVVTCGSTQSNFIRQLGAACSMFGLRCVAAVMDTPFDGAAGKPLKKHVGSRGGNVVLDEILGVELHRFPDDDWEVLYGHAAALVDQLPNAYSIPVGGSSPLGAYAFYEAAKELKESTFDWIIFASSSGSTHTGLAYAFDGTPTKVLGIACDPEPEITADFAEIGEGLAALIGHRHTLRSSEFLMDFGSVGGGYGVFTEESQAAISEMARREGIFLDPVYSGKAFAGLMRQAGSGEISGKVLFWHTGGLPALFAH